MMFRTIEVGFLKNNLDTTLRGFVNPLRYQ